MVFLRISPIAFSYDYLAFNEKNSLRVFLSVSEKTGYAKTSRSRQEPRRKTMPEIKRGKNLVILSHQKDCTQ
jgi:hypothetical protein